MQLLDVGTDGGEQLKRFHHPDHTLLQTVIAFQHFGFEILGAKAYQPNMTFFDMGAIVYYAAIIPWEFPDFNVVRCLPQRRIALF